MKSRQIMIKFNWDRIDYKGNYKNDYGFNRAFQQLKVNRSSGTRVYLSVYNNNIPMTNIAKKMNFENDKVIIRFGSDEVIIGSYTEE